MSKKLYPDNYEPSEVAHDRTPKPAQRAQARQLIKDNLGATGKSYEELMAIVDAAMPSVFTTSELFEILEDLQAKWLEKHPPKNQVIQ